MMGKINQEDAGSVPTLSGFPSLYDYLWVFEL